MTGRPPQPDLALAAQHLFCHPYRESSAWQSKDILSVVPDTVSCCRNLVQFLGACVSENNLVLVMELCEGELPAMYSQARFVTCASLCKQLGHAQCRYKASGPIHHG